jgi:hypothetical protein
VVSSIRHGSWAINVRAEWTMLIVLDELDGQNRRPAIYRVTFVQ